MHIIETFKRRRSENMELSKLQFKNALRRADTNAAISIAAIGEETAESLLLRAKHSKFKAQMEAIRDKLDLADKAISKKDIDTARAIEKAIDSAFSNLEFV